MAKWNQWSQLEVRAMLKAAANKAGPGVPLIVSCTFYMDMRWHILKEMEPETRPAYLKNAAVARWEDRWIFAFPNRTFGVPVERNRHGPEPYPEGTKIVKEFEATLIPEKGTIERSDNLYSARCARCIRVRSASHVHTTQQSLITFCLRAEGWSLRKKEGWVCPVCLGRCKPREFKRGPLQASDFDVG